MKIKQIIKNIIISIIIGIILGSITEFALILNISWLIRMTIIGILCTIYGWYNVSMSHNLFYNIDLGIIVGFAISIVICDRIRKNSNLLLKLKT